MSGVGKTHWAGRLAGCGFSVIHCDEKLVEILARQTQCPFRSLVEVGNWMQLPYTEDFAQREELYIAAETSVLEEIYSAYLLPAEAPARYLIDMGGSVIYLPPALLKQLKERLFIIYFDICEAVYQTMLQGYLANPLPLIWQGQFRCSPSGTMAEAFQTSYPRLIQYRMEKYRALADIILPYAVHRDPAFSEEDFTQWIARHAH